MFAFTAFALFSETNSDDDAALGAAGDYNAGDIAVINGIIDNNGLAWTKASADGDTIPADWTGVTWSGAATDKRIVQLQVQSKNLTGVLDVSGLDSLTTLYCYDNLLTSLDVSGLDSLTTLYCYDNLLTSLDVSGLDSLTYLYCDYNRLTSLDVSGLDSLTYLYCGGNRLTSLDVSGLDSLTYLDCGGNRLTSLDVSGLDSLTGLYCGGNRLTSLDVSGLDSLTTLYCYDNLLTSLDVSGLDSLTYLNCGGNRLTSLDVSGLDSLTYLYCDYNRLTSLDVSGLDSLTYLYCTLNLMVDENDVTGPDGNPGLSEITDVYFWPQMKELQIDGLDAGEIEDGIAGILATGDHIPLVTGTSTSTEDLSIDLQGLDLFWEAVYSGGALELTDSSASGSFYVRREGSLTVKSITSDSDDLYIYVQNGGSLTVSGNVTFKGESGWLGCEYGTITVSGDVISEGTNDGWTLIDAYNPDAVITIGGNVITPTRAVTASNGGTVTISGNVTANGVYAIECFVNGSVHVKGNISAPNGYGIYMDGGIVKVDGAINVKDETEYIKDGDTGEFLGIDDQSEVNVNGYAFEYTDGVWYVYVGLLPDDNTAPVDDNTMLIIGAAAAIIAIAGIGVYVFVIRPKA